MDKLTAIKIKYDDGTYSDEIPVSVLSENVEWDSTHTLVDVLGSIDVDVTGTIQDQISQLFNDKVSNTQLQTYVNNQLNIDVTNWLNTNVNPVGSAVVVDKTLSIEGAAGDAKIIGNKLSASDLVIKPMLHPGYITKEGDYSNASSTNQEVYTDDIGVAFAKTLQFSLSYSEPRQMWACYYIKYLDGTGQRTIFVASTHTSFQYTIQIPDNAISLQLSFRTFGIATSNFILKNIKSWKPPYETLKEDVEEIKEKQLDELSYFAPNVFNSLDDLELVADLTTRDDGRSQNFNINLKPGYYLEIWNCPEGYSIKNNQSSDIVSVLNPIIQILQPITKIQFYVYPNAMAGINIKLYKLSPQQINFIFNDIKPYYFDTFYINDYEQIMRTNNLIRKGNPTNNRISSLIRYEKGWLDFNLSSYDTYQFAIQKFNLDSFNKTEDTGWNSEKTKIQILKNECFIVVLRKSDNSHFSIDDIPENFVEVSPNKIFYYKSKDYNNYEEYLINNKIETLTNKCEENSNRIEELSSYSSTQEMLKNLRNEAPCYDHLYVSSNLPIVPHESLYHLRLSKNMGFKIIEANVRSTSDGVFIVNHFDGGKFGNYFHHADGVTDISNIDVNTVTWDWVVNNVRYNTSTPKFETRPCRLEEFLEECCLHNMIPFVASATTPSGIYAWEIAEKYMGKYNYIAYGGIRSIVKDAPIYKWDMTSNSVDEILNSCNLTGGTVIWASQLSRFEDNTVKEIIHTLHENGYFIGASYADANWDKYRKMGCDFNGTQSLINRINNANIISCHSDFSWNDFIITGSPTETNGVLYFENSGTIIPKISENIYNYAGYDIEIIFEGAVEIRSSSNSRTITHTTKNNFHIAKPIYNNSPVVTFIPQANTTIYDIHFKATAF